MVERVVVYTYLYDGEEVLFVRPFVGCDAAVNPSDGTMHRLLYARTSYGCADHIIQRHHYIRSDLVLELHRVFGSQYHC